MMMQLSSWNTVAVGLLLAGLLAAPNCSAQLLNGWVDYGYGYLGYSTRSLTSGTTSLCFVSGLIGSGTWTTFFQTTCKPEARLIFTLDNHEQVTRGDITAAGLGIYAGGSTKYGWVSLTPMLYTPTAGTGLSLLNGWVNNGGEYRGASITSTSNSLILLSGMIRSTSWASTIASGLPAPAGGHRIFGANVNAGSARVDIDASGNLLYISGKGTVDWVSLSGITYFSSSVTYTSFGMPAYGSGYAAPGYVVRDGLCYVGGMASFSGGLLGTLPAGCRPSARVVFPLLVGGFIARVDVLTDGRIFHIAGGGSGWISLEGLVFPV